MKIAGLILDALQGVMLDVVPVVVVLAGFQLFVLRKPLRNPRRVVAGFLCIFVGLGFFLVGLEQALFPIGKAMAAQLIALPEASMQSGLSTFSPFGVRYFWLFLFAFLMGTCAVLVEPAVIAVAIKANQLSSGAISTNGLRIAIALGVGVGITLGCIRIVTGGSFLIYLSCAYLTVVVQTVFAPKAMVPLAYDAGGVSTSTVTVPLVVALGLGLAMHIPGRSPLLDGFGMIAFAVIFPVISVLLYAQLSLLMSRIKGSQRTEGD